MGSSCRLSPRQPPYRLPVLSFLRRSRSVMLRSLFGVRKKGSKKGSDPFSSDPFSSFPHRWVTIVLFDLQAVNAGCQGEGDRRSASRRCTGCCCTNGHKE